MLKDIVAVSSVALKQAVAANIYALLKDALRNVLNAAQDALKNYVAKSVLAKVSAVAVFQQQKMGQQNAAAVLLKPLVRFQLEFYKGHQNDYIQLK